KPQPTEPAPAPDDSDDDPFALPIAAPAASAPAAPATTFSAPPPARRGLPVGAWIAIVGAGAFGMTLAIAVAGKMLSEPEPVAEALPIDETPILPSEAVVDVDPSLVDEAVEPSDVVEEPTHEGTDEPTATAMGVASAMRPTTTAPPTTTTAMSTLSAEEQARLALLTMGTASSSPTMIAVSGSGGSSGATNNLDDADVRRVVTAQSNQLALRRCYETAIRGMPEAPAVRLDVEITVGTSGTVTRVSATGQSVGNLTPCVEQTVRRWRFPASANGGSARFPVVFSGG
ncbi:MAG: AgmX/PglI C-terminal domain-containing protein, partial [Myxococcales bacterium]|nr:AgmX/PglI C-terminal domain-containing protein [Myxococcales bacterium]